MIQHIHCVVAAAAAVAGGEAPHSTTARVPAAAIVEIRLPPSEAVQTEPFAIPLVYADLRPMLTTAPAAPAEPDRAGHPAIAYRPLAEFAPPPPRRSPEAKPLGK